MATTNSSLYYKCILFKEIQTHAQISVKMVHHVSFHIQAVGDAKKYLSTYSPSPLHYSPKLKGKLKGEQLPSTAIQKVPENIGKVGFNLC